MSAYDPGLSVVFLSFCLVLVVLLVEEGIFFFVTKEWKFDEHRLFYYLWCGKVLFIFLGGLFYDPVFALILGHRKWWRLRFLLRQGRKRLGQKYHPLDVFRRRNLLWAEKEGKGGRQRSYRSWVGGFEGFDVWEEEWGVDEGGKVAHGVFFDGVRLPTSQRPTTRFSYNYRLISQKFPIILQTLLVYLCIRTL